MITIFSFSFFFPPFVQVLILLSNNYYLVSRRKKKWWKYSWKVAQYIHKWLFKRKEKLKEQDMYNYCLPLSQFFFFTILHFNF